MDKNLEELVTINPILAKLVDGTDLTAGEAEKLFYAVFVHDTEGLHFATLIGAIHAKGETADELLGFLNVTKSLAVKFDLGIDANKTIDLSGTGGGKLKTMNVSTAASFIVAACGYTVAKESYPGITSPTGSADVFAPFGINVPTLTKAQVEETLKEIGICLFHYFFISPQMDNRAKLSRKFFGERQISVRSPMHLVSNVYAPIPMNHRVYGCYSEKYLEILANLFMKLGFKRSLVFHGKIGIPEVSNVGQTIIVEQNSEELKRYTITPNDLGVEEAKEQDVVSGGKEQNVVDFVRILKGQEKGPKADLVAVNAGAALYALEDVPTIKEGVQKAKEVLADGRAYQVFERLIQKLGDINTLKNYS